MNRVIREIVKVEFPSVYATMGESPFRLSSAMFDTDRIRHLIQNESLCGEVFIERPIFDGIKDAMEIHPDNTAFWIRNISIDILGNVTALVEWFELDKRRIVMTYGDLHYYVRGVFNANDPTSARAITIDCITKKPVPNI
ncbi:MAG: hypothetical protein NC114_06705 [Ruminococcus flavefaciens]|nr:hypothetical protein [Ruminococcus flavefaciens]